jgi:riboflavin kinase/FMN adenylyltransferase
MNIGTRPTVEGKNQTIEVFFLDFDKAIYYESLTIEIIEFIRNEQKFDSLNDLKNQINEDKIFALNYINTNF